jgi:hypothetical protein
MEVSTELEQYLPSGTKRRWSERLLRGSTFIAQEKVRRGKVVMFASEPMFRGWWRALDRLVLNAALLGTAF